MKRFYAQADVAPQGDGFAVLLDGRPIRTPARAPLVVPTAALAAAIADEWNGQGEEIVPHAMPLTGIANAAIDLVAPDAAAFAAPLAAYGESDLLCYRAPETEAELAARQAQAWNPLLDRAERRHGIEFALTSGVMHVPQPAATVAALADDLSRRDAFALAALSPLVTIGGSLVVALALADGAQDANTLWDAVTLDERFQEERWGADADATAAREARQAQWRAAAHFLSLLDRTSA